MFGLALSFYFFCGAVAGFLQDVPGLNDDPLGNGLLTSFAYIFQTGSSILRNYPLGVVIYIAIAAAGHMFFTYPHHEKLRDEVKRARQRKRSKTKKNPAKINSRGKRTKK